MGHLLIPQFDLVRIARATVLQLIKRMGPQGEVKVLGDRALSRGSAEPEVGWACLSASTTNSSKVGWWLMVRRSFINGQD